MPINSIFLDWGKPCLLTCASYLAKSNESLDFSDYIVAVPGARAGRALLSYLVDFAEKAGRPLTPPRFVTPGKLRELVVEANRGEARLASKIEKQAAWLKVLREPRAGQLLTAIIRQLPEEGDTRGWLALGSVIDNLLEELSSAGLTFSSALKKAAHCVGFSEEERWNVINEVALEYAKVLSDAGLRDERDVFLEILAAGGPLEFPTNQLVIASLVDLAPALEEALLKTRCQITALIHADKSDREGFSATGRLCHQYWGQKEVAIEDQNLVVCFKPADQALAATSIIRKLDCPLEQISVGILDPELTDFVRGEMVNSEIPIDEGSGIPFDDSSPALLLKALSDYLRSGGFRELAALARHSDFERALQNSFSECGEIIEPGILPIILDRYHAKHLPFLAQAGATSNSKESEQYGKVHEACSKLLSAFFDSSRPLSEWVLVISDFLRKIYGSAGAEAEVAQSQASTQAALLIHERLTDVSRMNSFLDIKMPAGDAIVFVVTLLKSALIPRERVEGAVAMFGWLELRLDDSPVLLAMGFNDGFIPEAVVSDPFLPDGLRSSLGLTDNAKRYARDAYAMSSLLAGKSKIILLSGRQSASGDPLAPSRLLLSTEPAMSAQRLLKFYDPAASGFSSGGDEPPGSFTTDSVKEPEFAPYNFSTLSVTAFKDYLRCPYRFYLKHALKLESVNDHQLELDGRAFGTIAHDALSGLNKAIQRAALSDENELYNFISGCVEEKFFSIYRDNALPAVAFQKIQLLDRLWAFCKWQVEWSRQGWEILTTELPFDGSFTQLEVDGSPVGITGRIDRIDYNRETGELAVFDYKTSDMESSAAKSHKNKSGWLDLQLPLYYYMIRRSNIKEASDITPERCKLGYISISRTSSESKSGFSFASWSESDLEEAFEVAAEVVRNIRKGRFWPPAALSFDDEYSGICRIAGGVQ